MNNFIELQGCCWSAVWWSRDAPLCASSVHGLHTGDELETERPSSPPKTSFVRLNWGRILFPGQLWPLRAVCLGANRDICGEEEGAHCPWQPPWDPGNNDWNCCSDGEIHSWGWLVSDFPFYQALSEMYGRPIHIYCYSQEPINIFQHIQNRPGVESELNIPIRFETTVALSWKVMEYWTN